jgi:outer membrane receptor for ferrienterochelin and colicins
VRVVGHLVFAGVLPLLFSAALVAQSPAAGSLTGIVTDASGARVPGVTVIVSSDRSPVVRVVDGSPHGAFAVDGLPPGTYRLSLAASGFRPLEVTVDVPAAAPVSAVLAPAPVIEEVRVTSASRQDELRAALNTRVDVVTRSRIDDSGAETVGEVLREIPGVVTRRGSEGAGAGHQIQGIDSKQVLVLLDGLPLVGARGVKRGGAINLDRQPTARLDRVEVVKGAASALYGSDAIGGVINLITREPRSPFHAGAALSGGSRGDVNALTEIGLRRGSWSGLFNVERHQSDGFDLTPTTFDTTAAAFRRHDAFAKLRWSPAGSLALTGLVTGYRNRATGRSNGELGPQEDDIRERTLNTALTADWAVTGMTSIQLRGSVAGYDERSTGRLAPPRSTPVDPGALSERLSRADAAVTQIVGTRHLLQGGVEYVHDEYAGINRLRNDAGEDASTLVGWAQHRVAGTRVSATTGLRLDRHSQFGHAVSPKIGANLRLAGDVSLRASVGRGFRAPDIGQLYYRFLNPTNFYQVIGNPHLAPERARSLQIGADYQRQDRRARLGVNVFRNAVRDLIESHTLGFVATPAQLQAMLAAEGLDGSFRPVLGRLLITYRNVDEAVTQGVEVDGETALTRSVVVAGGYTFLDARDGRSDLELTGRSRHHGHARVGWVSDRIGLRANLRLTAMSSWIAARAAGVDTRAAGFAVLDAYVSQRVANGLHAFAAIDNLSNSRDPNAGVMLQTAPAPIYRPEAGRTVRFGVRWSWSQQ